MSDMQDSLRELYQEVIFDHNRNPRNYRPLPAASHHADGHNPLCGDQLTLTLRRAGDRIEDLRFEGNGCAISMASASMMTEAVKGKDRAAATVLADRIHDLLTREGASSEGLGKLAALSGVREFPARVKCASLCWHTLNAALAQSDNAAPTVSTE